MIFDQNATNERHGDQAEGLRQLRRIDHGTSTRVADWPRVVLISEVPGTDIGARFAFHLACALGRQAVGHSSGSEHSLLVDLAPAASRLPHILADWIPANCYRAMWAELAVGRTLVPVDLGDRLPISVSAESRSSTPAMDQLPRLYEQLVRQLGRGVPRWRWIVLIALDQILPLDRACWQAADDIILLGNRELTGCHRQAAALRSRVLESDPQRTIWTVPKRATSWIHWGSEGLSSSKWIEAGIAPKQLPPVRWPNKVDNHNLRFESRIDRGLQRSAVRVAKALCGAVQSQMVPAESFSPDRRLDLVDGANVNDPQKKIQLGPHFQPITEITEEYRV